jgi:hypothetical protein
MSPATYALHRMRASLGRARRWWLRVRIDLACEAAVEAFIKGRERQQLERDPLLHEHALSQGQLARIDRQLAAYQRRYGLDHFVHEHLLYVHMRMHEGFCHDWELVCCPEQLGGAISAYAGAQVMHRQLPSLLCDGTLQRLWWTDLQEMAIEHLVARGGQRIYDHERPRYGND